MKKEYDFSKTKRGIDNVVLEEFRQWSDESDRGYQTIMNEALREYLGRSFHPVDETASREILREELTKDRRLTFLG